MKILTKPAGYCWYSVVVAWPHTLGTFFKLPWYEGTDGSEKSLHTKLSLSLRFELSSNLVETQLHLGLS